MYRAIFLAAVISIACDTRGPIVTNAKKVDRIADEVWRVQDPDSAVTCWIFSGYKSGGISCLPEDAFSQRDGGTR